MSPAHLINLDEPGDPAAERVSKLPALARELNERAKRVAQVAATHAASVDAQPRFPAEAIAALREQRLLGAMVPVRHGGEAASISQVADICYVLGRACASTAMIYAMHQVKVACLTRHVAGQPSMEAFARRIAREQLLVASSTTEGNNGGNVRSSEGAVVTDGDTITLDRHASVISYGASADALMTTARRNPEAANSDQVLVVVHKDHYTLASSGGWNTLGMRGTMSEGFRLHVAAPRDTVMNVPYAIIHAQSMVPSAHILWSSVWAGIAAAALEKARLFVRTVARKAGGTLPPGAASMTRATSKLQMLRALIKDVAAKYEGFGDDVDAIGAMAFQSELLMLKVQASELAVEIVHDAMRAGGLAAYRQDGEFSIARHLRDIMAAPVMIHNDRILANAVSSSIMAEIAPSLLDVA
ncbi:MAG: acyl-CoA/acyl-ACP dehydrogenase [Alphaproteobacteria bacterium]|nr:acyl-CoA/acyl-ACP dehydrogenase [Alphaproteobacteria bacterium]